jgi:hypothetical protein
LVEVNQKIPDRDEAKLRLAVQGGEPSAASRVFDGTPASRAPLTLLPAREATGVPWHCKKERKKDDETLDNAADVIHGKWPIRNLWDLRAGLLAEPIRRGR